MSDEHLAMLQGRILAQELLTRYILTACLNPADPLGALDELRNAFRTTLQNAQRPVGEEEDAIWDAAMTALFSELDNVEARLRDNA